MMICFWENTFWAKTSLSFVFRGPNSMHLAHPEVFRHAKTTFFCNGTSFNAVYKFQNCLMICFWENTFWAKTSLYFVLSSPNTEHPEVFRHANHNGTSFKAVWWSVSDKTHFGLKHHFPLYLEGQTLHTLRFSGMPIVMVQVSKLYDDLFLRKHILG